MKTLIRTLLFFLIVTQICFGQWIPLLQNYSIRDIAVKDSILFAVTSDSCYLNGQGITCCGKVFRSTDNGSSWSIIVDSEVLDIAISLSGKIFMIKGGSAPWAWGDSLYSSLDNGNTWININIMGQLIGSIPEGMPQNITISPEGIIYCGIHFPGWGIGDVLANSIDDGVTWTTPGTGILSGKLYDFRDHFVITVGEFRCISTCGWWWEMYLSSDYGNTWEMLTECGSYLDEQFISFFSNGNIIIDEDNLGSTSPNGIYLSTNLCSTWTKISSLDCQVGLSFQSEFLEGMLIGTDSLGVFLFSDDGDSLGSRNDGFINSLSIQSLTLDNNGYVYAGTENGIWQRPLSEIIPVELTSFTATTNGKEVVLNWTTETELNNLGFEIKRSKDNVSFNKIGFVPGFGTTTEPKSYSFIDSEVSTGKYTYRLKQIDFDGSYEYSKEVEVEVSTSLEFSLEQNYPNPFNPSTVISYQLPVSSDVTLKVYDILGNEIATLVNENRPAGKYEIEFDPVSGTRYPASGIYFYQLKAGKHIAVKKMIFIK